MATLDYYNTHADEYTQATVHLDFSATQDRFLACLEPHAHILDFGCGSGRDSLYFLQHGYHVTAIDGSSELCKKARELTGLQVRQQLFQDLNDREAYDGIWACSSILHLDKATLIEVFNRIANALKPDGFLYTSFKYGTFEGERHGRYFTDFTWETFQQFHEETDSKLLIIDHWITHDIRPGRGDEQWLNLLFRKH